MIAQKSPSASDLLEVVFRHRRKAVLIPLVVLGLGLMIALFAPRSYRSEAKLALQVGRQSVTMDPTAQTGQQLVSIQQMGREGEVTTAIELIKSRGVISKVVDRLGVEFIERGGPEGSGEGESNVVAEFFDSTVGAAMGYAIASIKSIDPISDREEAIIDVERNLSAEAERDSTLITLTYSTKTPAGAKAVLDTLIDVYREEHLRINRNEGSRSFFVQQEKLIRDDLDAAMDKVREAKNEIGVASIGDRRSNLEAQLQSITLAAYQTESQRAAEVAELVELRRQLGELPERLIASKKSIPNAGADMLREQLYALQVRQADLKARYSDTHPLVVAISQQIEEAERVVDDQSSVREETTDDVNPIYRSLSLSAKQKESTVTSLEAKLEALHEQDATIRADLEKLNADEVRLAQLEREESILSRKYFRYTDNLEQTRIDKELENQEVSSISVAQDPTLAEKPVSPSKVIVALASLVLAFAGTSATILGLEQLNDKPSDERSIERASGAQVLASIPDSTIHGRILAS